MRFRLNLIASAFSGLFLAACGNNPIVQHHPHAENASDVVQGPAQGPVQSPDQAAQKGPGQYPPPPYPPTPTYPPVPTVPNYPPQQGADCAAVNLGIGWTYNVFLSGDLRQSGTDIEGTAAVGGDAILTNYSIGARRRPPDGAPSLVVGHNLEFHDGSVRGGGIAYGGSAMITNANSDGPAVQGLPFDFAAATATLQSAASTLASCGPTGQPIVTGSPGSYTVVLQGSYSGTAVIQIDGALLAQTRSLRLAVAPGTRILVVVHGPEALLSNMGMDLGGADPAQVLFVFAEARNIYMNGIGFQGSIIAPWSTVRFDNGVLHGQLAAAALLGTGQINADPPWACGCN